MRSKKKAVYNGKGGRKMYALFDKTKVRSWIKKAHKEGWLAYGYGYVTDNRAVLIAEPPMFPTVLELYGTLTPGCRYAPEQFQKLMTLPDEPIEMVDSRLEFIVEPKLRLRIFYNPKTGKELTINCTYFNFLKDTKECTFWTNDEVSRLWIVCDNEAIALIAPYRLENQLSHVSFKKVEEEREQD
jgi:hypothetical protein